MYYNDLEEEHLAPSYCVVTAFHPTDRLRDLVEVLEAEAKLVVIVDNTEGGSATAADLAGAGVVVLRNGYNAGLAAALNRGIEYLNARRCVGFVSLWDQDSHPPKQYLDEVCRWISNREAAVPMRGPILAGGRQGGLRSIDSEADRAVIEPLWIITSGMTFRLSTWQMLGGFREDFVVDAVDIDFCLKARDVDGSINLLSWVCFEHELGDGTQMRRAVGFKTSTSGHKPWRLYWITRNVVVLIREYWSRDRSAVWEQCKALIRWNLRAVVGGPSRWSTSQAMGRGILDGLRGSVDPRYDPRP